MQTIVAVAFKQGGKNYYFDPKDIKFNDGDGVIVETANGLAYATVISSNKQVDDDSITGTLKPVLRRATKRDNEINQANLSKRPRAMEEARKLIEKHKLEMKLVDAEYMFDGSKIIFTFTSEGRVDFRELVKDLVGTLRSRVELKQIGIRDECKEKGGLGPCGRVCCCNSYMSDFERVSIKMAKTQGLSLNPTKISGLCGRLMCCLAFENEYYKDINKYMPKLGKTMATPAGNGVVEAVDMLKQTVRLRVQLANGDMERNTYTLAELGIVVEGAESSCEGCQSGCGGCHGDNAAAATEVEKTETAVPVETKEPATEGSSNNNNGNNSRKSRNRHKKNKSNNANNGGNANGEKANANNANAEKPAANQPNNVSTTANGGEGENGQPKANKKKRRKRPHKKPNGGEGNNAAEPNNNGN